MISSASYRAGLRPDPKLLVSEWADKHRVLTGLTSAEPGHWRTDRTPYLREIMDCMSPDCDIEEIIFMKPTQVGASECGFNMIGYTVDQMPSPIMLVMPTSSLCKRVSKQRITPMIEACPPLKEKFAKKKSRDSTNTVMMKDFTGGTLVLAGANSAVELRQMSCRVMIFDEIDGYPLDVDGEGSPIEIAVKRSDTFSRNRKIAKFSTPTTEEHSQIEEEYLDSDQRKYHVPCPHCDHKQVLLWRGIKFDQDENKRPINVHYECEACHGEINEGHKTYMLANGDWIADAPFDGKKAGFWLNALYSPVGWYSWEMAVKDFLKAKRSKTKIKLKTWTNTVLAEVWRSQGVRVEWENIYKRREHYAAECPEGGVLLVAGVDVQDDRLEGEVQLWNKQEECWTVDYWILEGDPSRPELWKRLEERLFEQTYQHESGVMLKIAATGLDTGGHYTQQAYDFAWKHRARRVYAIKGSSKRGAPIAPRPSKAGARKQDLYVIGTDTAKDMIYARADITEPGAGYHHFPVKPIFNEQYFQGFTAEEKKTKYKNGFPYMEYAKIYQRNEPIDCNVYAYAALLILNPAWNILNKKLDKRIESSKEETTEEPDSKAEPKKKKQKRVRRGRGFVNKFSR